MYKHTFDFLKQNKIFISSSHSIMKTEFSLVTIRKMTSQAHCLALQQTEPQLCVLCWELPWCVTALASRWSWNSSPVTSRVPRVALCCSPKCLCPKLFCSTHAAFRAHKMTPLKRSALTCWGVENLRTKASPMFPCFPLKSAGRGSLPNSILWL